MSVQRPDQFGYPGRVGLGVVVEQGYDGAASGANTRIDCAREALIGRQRENAHCRVLRLEQHPRAVGRRVVNDNDLNRRIGLTP